MLFTEYRPSTVSVIVTFEYLSCAYQFAFVNPKITKPNANMKQLQANPIAHISCKHTRIKKCISEINYDV